MGADCAARPTLVLPGDRFIIRMFSPVVTIGGGVVVDLACRKYLAARLIALAGGDARTRVELLVAEQSDGMEKARLTALTGLREIPPSPAIETAGEWLIGSARATEWRRQLPAVVRQFHREHSLLPGIPKQDLKGRVMPDAAPEIFDHVLATSPEVVQEGEVVKLRSHRVVLKFDEEQARMAIEGAFEKAGLTAPAVQDVLKSSGVEAARARSILQICCVRESWSRCRTSWYSTRRRWQGCGRFCGRGRESVSPSRVQGMDGYFEEVRDSAPRVSRPRACDPAGGGRAGGPAKIREPR